MLGDNTSVAFKSIVRTLDISEIETKSDTHALEIPRVSDDFLSTALEFQEVRRSS